MLEAPDLHIQEGQPTVLVVDDEPTLVALVRTMLWRAGFTVLEATGPEEALRIASRTPHVDVLLTDILMPGMNGYELAAQLRSKRPEIKVLFMSGYRDRAILESTGVAVEDLSLVRKPFTQYTLVSRIGELLADSRPSTSNT